jgi:predicted DNA binding protein
VADILGVSQPTVSRHVRRGQQKMMDMVFDDGSKADPDG